MKSYSFESTAHVAHITDPFPAQDAAQSRLGSDALGPILVLLGHVLRTERRTGTVPFWFSAAMRKAFPMDCGGKESGGDGDWNSPDFLASLSQLAHWARLAQCEQPAELANQTHIPLGDDFERFAPDDEVAVLRGRTEEGVVLAFKAGSLVDRPSWEAIYETHVKWFRRGECPLDSFSEAKVNVVYQSGLETVWPLVLSVAHNATEKILLTGHGGGGALAALAALRIRTLRPAAALQVVTFGSPPAGDEQFAARYDQAISDHWRVETENDLLPHFPLSALMSKVVFADASIDVSKTRYQHVGGVLYLTRDGQVPHVGTVVTQRDRRLRLFSILASTNREKAFDDHSLELSYLPRLEELRALCPHSEQEK